MKIKKKLQKGSGQFYKTFFPNSTITDAEHDAETQTIPDPGSELHSSHPMGRDVAIMETANRGRNKFRNAVLESRPEIYPASLGERVYKDKKGMVATRKLLLLREDLMQAVERSELEAKIAELAEDRFIPLKWMIKLLEFVRGKRMGKKYFKPGAIVKVKAGEVTRELIAFPPYYKVKKLDEFLSELNNFLKRERDKVKTADA